MRKAVIDVGSNSVLLTVEEELDRGWRSVHESTWVTSLGEGTRETGLLSPKAIERTLSAISEAWQRAQALGSDNIVAAATMAARQAANREVFLEASIKQGTPVRILSGDDEADLGFRSVAGDPLFETAGRLTIIDVGGQSTELATAERSGEGWTFLFRKSFAIGTLGLRGGVLKNESPGMQDLLAAVCEIDETIGLACLPMSAGIAVALGATGTNLVTVREAMTEWNPEKVHGARLDYEEVSKAAGWLSTMTDEERRSVPGMEPGREKTIHIGALILERFLFASRSLGCYVSVRGWRHALLESGYSPRFTQ